MRKATRLTSMGLLMDATRMIQNALFDATLGAGMGSAPEPATQPTAKTTIKGVAKAAVKAFRPAANDAVQDIQARYETLFEAPSRGASNAPFGAPADAPAKRPAFRPDAASPQTGGPSGSPASFTEGSFAYGGDAYPYRLYVPPLPPQPSPPSSAGHSAQRLPLVVLLHGCTQNALDFSKGTAMNKLAGQQGVMVLYPEQITKANSGRCWNWFEPGHQKRGQGEPGMIAALTQQVLAAEHNGHRADPDRVYVAGLSAGGAMAAVVAGLYPDLFAALGVHSGLPAGAAKDMVSAFSAMRRGSKSQSAKPPKAAAALPTIVFHGSADTTVHPDNGEGIAGSAQAAYQAQGLSLVKTQAPATAAGERASERTTYRAANDASYVEYWTIDSGPHAWSGGSKSGTYTDPDGPSASKAMLAFFLQHRKT